MSDQTPFGMERAIEIVLTTGLIMSALVLIAGLLLQKPSLLHMGLLLLMLTPVARVVLVTTVLFSMGQWFFGLLSLWILIVLGFSFSIAHLFG